MENKPPSFNDFEYMNKIQKSLSRPFKVSGFTFVRNGVKFGYPFRESILSLLPSVDELIVNVGESEDSTLPLIQELAEEYSKIKIIQSKWNDQLRSGGKVLAEQTDIALQACSGKWGIYLQADEVLHEDDYMWTLDALKRADADPSIDGLLFDYLHFYGSYQIVNWNPSMYRREIRAIRLNKGVFSYGDAQGFRKRTSPTEKGEKINVILANSRIYHYGWVRPTEVMREKTVSMDKLYHGENKGTGNNYQYKRIYGLEKFSGTHPLVMQERVKGEVNAINLLETPLYFHWKDIRKVFTRGYEKFFGKRLFEYRNYNLHITKS